jgi:thiamine biosynthesis lipoprotein
VSVTVLHPSAALADAAATALLVAGPARWRRVAERLGVDQVLLIDRHGRRSMTDRMAARLA